MLNWIDIIIIVVGIYYVLIGWESGLIRLATRLISFLISLWLATRFHTPVGEFLTNKFGFPPLWAGVAGLIAVAFMAEAILVELLKAMTDRLPAKVTGLKINKILGALLSVANCLVIMAFMLMLVLILPLRGSAKKDIQQSLIGSRLVFLAERYGGDVKSSVNKAAQEAVKFLTIKPSSDEKVDLHLQSTELSLSIDEQSEQKMLELINAEREKNGLKKLRIDPKLKAAARAHSTDMFERSYFSHYDPEGHDVGYRLDQVDAKYTLAGENLAYAPDVDTAHTGLMNSEGHRRNILELKFTRVGIGVIDAGVYGKMFTQEFAD
jgi:uncharacterized protein YkwD